MEEPEEPKRGFTGYWIPVEIVNDPHLRSLDKLLLAEIVALSQNEGKACWASNEHLAKHVGLTSGGVANALTRLRRRGYIEDVSFDGRHRKIRATVIKADSMKGWKQGSSKDEGSLNERMKENISGNKKENKRKAWLPSVDFIDEDLQTEWAAYQMMYRQKWGAMTVIARGRKVAKLSALDKDKALTELRKSTMNEWKDFAYPDKQAKPKLPYRKREDRINFLNRKKQELVRSNAPYWKIHEIDMQLSKL